MCFVVWKRVLSYAKCPYCVLCATFPYYYYYTLVYTNGPDYSEHQMVLIIQNMICKVF